MGMFDRVVVQLPLPDGSTVTEFQTKSLERTMDEYEIREDGTLWRQAYDIEDQSDPNAKGMMRFAGSATRINKHWVQVTDFTGEIEFHRWDSEAHVMHTYSVYFVEGALKVGPIKMKER